MGQRGCVSEGTIFFVQDQHRPRQAARLVKVGRHTQDVAVCVVEPACEPVDYQSAAAGKGKPASRLDRAVPPFRRPPRGSNRVVGLDAGDDEMVSSAVASSGECAVTSAILPARKTSRRPSGYLDRQVMNTKPPWNCQGGIVSS